jgi:large subunit ribosomal protein L10
MSKAIKAMITEDMKDRYAGASSACVVELTGLDVQAQEKIRRELRAKSARLQVVKNSLARHAFKGGPLAPLGEALQGPCALVTGPESMIEVAKYLVEAAKEFKSLKLKAAVYEGDTSLISIEAMSKLRGKREILGELAMLVASPGRALAGCIASPQAKIAGCLKAIADKAA